MNKFWISLEKKEDFQQKQPIYNILGTDHNIYKLVKKQRKKLMNKKLKVIVLKQN
jgi:hypothetical protein